MHENSLLEKIFFNSNCYRKKDGVSLFCAGPFCYTCLKLNIKSYSFLLVDYKVIFITGRNEVVAKVMFLHLFVILFTGGGVCLGACWDTTHPPKEQTPPRSRHPPPRADTPPHPRSRHPPEPTPSPPIRSMSGRYASYWNAFLFSSVTLLNQTILPVHSVVFVDIPFTMVSFLH